MCRRARLVRRVNTCELLINTVIGNRPKMLTGLNQKVRGPVDYLAHREHSGRRTTPVNETQTRPDPLYVKRNLVNPYRCLTGR